MDKILECKICFSKYDLSRKPLILFCGHTLCSICIKSVIEQNKACPTCRTVIQQSIDQLPVNYALLEFANSSEKDDSSSNENNDAKNSSHLYSCSEHENRQLEYYCDNLELWLCDVCCDIHDNRHMDQFGSLYTCTPAKLDDAIQLLKTKGQKSQVDKLNEIQEIIDKLESMSKETKSVEINVKDLICETTKNRENQDSILEDIGNFNDKLKSHKKRAMQLQFYLTEVIFELSNVESIQEWIVVESKLKDNERMSNFIFAFSEVQKSNNHVCIKSF